MHNGFLLFFPFYIWGQETSIQSKFYQSLRGIDAFEDIPLKGKIQLLHSIGCVVDEKNGNFILKNSTEQYGKPWIDDYTLLFDKKGNITHIYKYDEQGNIIQNLFYDYSYNENNQLTKESYYKNDIQIYTYNYKYDKKGNKTEEIYNNVESKEKYFRKYTYATYNRLILVTEKKSKSKNSTIILKKNYQGELLLVERDKYFSYNYRYHNGKLVQKEEYRNIREDKYTEINIKRVYLYNDSGLLVSKDTYVDYDHSKDSFFYDEKGRVVKIVYYPANNDRNITNIIFKYDEKDNILEKEIYEGEKMERKYIFQYDKYNNCTKIEDYSNGKLSYIYERNITYYE